MPGKIDQQLQSIVSAIERVAAVLMAVLVILNFVTVAVRKVGGYSLPDAFDIGRLMLGIAIFWGIASACYRNGHILVDILWDLCGPRGKRWIDITATVLLLMFMVPFAWKFMFGVFQTRASNVQTFELHLPIWPWHFVAALGIVSAAVLTAIRLWELAVRPPQY